MAEAKKKTWGAAGETHNLITVVVIKLREALKHTFDGVAMLFDCIGVEEPIGADIPVDEPKAKQTGNPEETRPENQDTTASPEGQTEETEDSPPEETPEPKKQEEPTPVKETHSVANTVTQDDITRIIVRKIKQDRANNEKIGAILKTYGVSKVSDLPAAKYEAFLTDLSQI